MTLQRHHYATPPLLADCVNTDSAPASSPIAICAQPCEFSPAHSLPRQYTPSPQLLYYPSSVNATPEMPLPLTPSQQPPPAPQQPGDAYGYYQHYYYTAPAAAATAPCGHRHSPDLSTGTRMSPPTPVCYPYGYSSPPPPLPPTCCCCAPLHFHHQGPCCAQQEPLFQRAPMPQLPTLLTPPPLPLPLQQQPKAATNSRLSPQRFSSNDSLELGAATPAAAPPSAWPVDSSQRPQHQQQRRRNGYMHNILYKTELCRDRGSCPRGRACQFAHSPAELHDPRRHPLYKTAACFDFQHRGHCPRGDLCFHVHERETPTMATAPLPLPAVLALAAPAKSTPGKGRQSRRNTTVTAAVATDLQARSLKPLNNGGGQLVGSSGRRSRQAAGRMKDKSGSSSKAPGGPTSGGDTVKEARCPN